MISHARRNPPSPLVIKVSIDLETAIHIPSIGNLLWLVADVLDDLTIAMHVNNMHDAGSLSQ